MSIPKQCHEIDDHHFVARCRHTGRWVLRHFNGRNEATVAEYGEVLTEADLTDAFYRAARRLAKADRSKMIS